MNSIPQETSNTQLNELENKSLNRKDSSKNYSSSNSINHQDTTDNSENTSIIASKINKISKTQRSLTPTIALKSSKNLYIKFEFFPENGKNKKVEKKTEAKKEETTKNENSIKISDSNKDTTNTKEDQNINIQKDLDKKSKKNNDYNDYTQVYSRNDFKDRPPKIPGLYIQKYNYENENIFSHSNDTSGIIKDSKNVPNTFYNHLVINNKSNEKYATVSINKRDKGKLVKFIFYAP